MKITEITPQIAALYIGQKWEIPKTKRTFIAKDVFFTGIGDGDRIQVSLEYTVPHLRRLESLTEEEARELYEISHGAKFPKNGSALVWWNNPNALDYTNKEIEIGTPAVWLKLLEWGIDLFGLINLGLAKEIKS